MNKQINVEDNIFALYLRLRMVRDILILDTDGSLFLDKILGDLEYIGETLEVLLKFLEENTVLFNRRGQFDNLCELEWQFFQLLGEFLNNGGVLSMIKQPQIRGRLQALRDQSDARQRLIEQTIPPEDQHLAEPVVSGAELSELLRDL
jgi:hypothetical protein